MGLEQKPDPRTVLANERTFLSWLRTGVNLMAFGFVVSKFDLFLHIRNHSKFYHGFLGLTLVAGGVITLAIGTLHYRRNYSRLQKNKTVGTPTIPMLLGMITVAVGLIVFYYLFKVR